MNQKNGSSVVVVGGSSGIGLASALLLNERGFRVTAVGRDEEKLRRATNGTAISAVAMDVTSAGAVDAFFQRHQALDHLVITVSGSKGAGPFAQVSAEQLQEGFIAKFFAHWRVARASLPFLSARGSITFVSAISARASMPGTAGLAAINGAIEAMIKPLASELKPRRINAVSPGVIETPWWDGLPEGQRTQLLASTAAASAVGRNGKADEVAEAIAFLVTNEFVTGSVLEVDGGLRLD